MPSGPVDSLVTNSISNKLADCGASFFFTNYTYTARPFTPEYHEWLQRSYATAGRDHPLRAAIEAVGMAGLANVRRSSYQKSLAAERYQEAIATVKLSLADEDQARSDEMFLAVILLAFYEVSAFVMTSKSGV